MTSGVDSDSQRTFRVLMLAPTSFFADYGCHVRILEEARMPHFLGGRCRLGENQWEDRRRRKPRCAISIAWIFLYASPCPWFGLEARAQVLNYGSLRVHQSFEKIMVSTITMGVQRTKICTTTRFCDRVLLWLLVLCCKKPMGRMIMTKKLTSVSILLSLALMIIPFRAAFAAGSVSLVTEYPLPGSPLHVAVETSGRVWVTLPAENKIARLQVTSPGVYDVHTYQLPTPDSHPYDIVYAAGSVWVTENTGNKIARFDPAAGTAGEWTEYTIPTTASHPTGLTVLPGDPIQVWFCEQASDKLGLLTITAAGASQFAEFPLPQAWAGAALENIAATSSENVWFTAPGRSGIIQFVLPLWPDREPFGFVSTGLGTKPHDIKIAVDNLPWFTEPGTNRIARFVAGTIESFKWFSVSTPNSGLAGLELALGRTWFTEQLGGKVGQLQEINYEGRMREQPLPGPAPAPTDIAVGPDGCAWVSASGADALMSWCPPYFRPVYLPLIQRR